MYALTLPVAIASTTGSLSLTANMNKKSEKLTHWGRVTHICVGNLTIIGPDNGLSPGRRQAIIWTIAGILLIGPLGTNFSGVLIGIQTFSFKKMHLKVSSAKWRPFCLGLNVLITNPRWASVTIIFSCTDAVCRNLQCFSDKTNHRPVSGIATYERNCQLPLQIESTFMSALCTAIHKLNCCQYVCCVIKDNTFFVSARPPGHRLWLTT